MLLLRHKIGNKIIRIHKFHGPLVTVGTSRGCHLRLFGDEVGPQHLVFERQTNGVWTVMDLGLKSGTLLNGQPIVEAVLSSRCSIQIGNHTLEFVPAPKARMVFKDYDGGKLKTPFKTSSEEQLLIVRRGGRILASQVFPASLPVKVGRDEDAHFRLDVPTTIIPVARRTEDPHVHIVGAYEILRVPIAHADKAKSVKFQMDPEMKKPLGISVLAVVLFLAAFLGIPLPEEEKKPDNVYTRMIFDSKILKERKAQLKNAQKFMAQGSAGQAAKTPVALPKTQNAQAGKTIASLRTSGLQSVIGKIAARASSGAKLLAALGRMPSAEASLGPAGGGLEMGKVAAIGKAGTGKGFQLQGVGTSGKGGGNAKYGEGTGLGQGSIGAGAVGLDDEESVIEGGLDREVIAAVIREHLGQIRYCYERQLAGQPELHGKVKVKFGIDAQGEVFTQTVGETTLNSAIAEECILRRVAKWKFPKPKGGTQVMVSYPFLFKSVQ